MIELTADAQTIGLISFGLSLVGGIVRHIVLDKDMLKEHKSKMKDIKDKMKEAQKNQDVKGMQKHQSDLMSLTMEQMKHSFKPMIFTMVPFILVFKWLRDTYGAAGTVVKLFGFQLGWFGWYFVCAVVSGMIINKLLGNT